MFDARRALDEGATVKSIIDYPSQVHEFDSDSSTDVNLSFESVNSSIFE